MAASRADSMNAAQMEDSSAQNSKLTDEEKIRMQVKAWNDANNKKDAAKLEKLYAEEVVLYGEQMSNTDAAANKEALFNKSPDFRQVLGDSITVKKTSENTARADFIKNVSAHGRSQSYSAYLQFEKTGRAWQITEESDMATDKKLSQTVKPMPVKQITSCDKAAEAIFLSSADVRKQLQQKYVRYKMEYRPDDHDAPNRRYWFWIFANSPNSREVETYSRYEVDPITGQLYEYKAVEDKAVKVPYDKGLNKYLQQYCGK